jgi:LPXTG-site transpeptidase (sortase) family protein
MNVRSIIALCVILVAAAIFAATLVHSVWYAPDQEIAGPIVAATSSDPVRLSIPSLDIDAKVQQVGLTTAGNMGIPNNFTDVAWYKYGPRPGQLGSAVIDGHVDNGLSLAGVFKHLEDIKVGDDVYVQEKDGSKLHFVVTDIESYPYKNAPVEQIFTRTDKARLNLITCVGDWIPAGKTYDHRLVVYTELSAR